VRCIVTSLSVIEKLFQGILNNNSISREKDGSGIGGVLAAVSQGEFQHFL